MRVLILDFDFFSAVGGGQTFYRRVVSRHRRMDFHYPSRGPDLKAAMRRHLPANAVPFGFDSFTDVWDVISRLALEWLDVDHLALLCRIALAWQGSSFDIVEIPSFFPAAHLIRPVFAAYGIAVGRVSIGLLGWLSTSTRNAYQSEGIGKHAAIYADAERRSMAAADIRYTISDLHAGLNAERELPIATVDMHDALEDFPLPAADPPGEGPPDLWYVGRLDRNKGPDLFVEIAARLPRSLYGRCRLAGPDNLWVDGERWSHRIEALAAERNIEAHYVGQLPDEEVRKQVYGGRSLLVVPSRTDAFNYVAIEALANGCPVLLSKHAGVAGFLAARHPSIAPPIIDPEDIDGSAMALRRLLETYPQSALTLRENLRRAPLPRPRQDFMAAIWSGAPVRSRQSDGDLSGLHSRILAQQPLAIPAARNWRTRGGEASAPVLSCILWMTRPDAEAARTLVSLSGASLPGVEVLVVDDGSSPGRPVRRAIRAILPEARILRQSAQGRVAAWNRGLAASQAPHVCFLEPGDGFDRWLLESMMATLRRGEPDAVAIWAAMRLLHIDGRPYGASENRAASAAEGEQVPDARSIAILSRPALDRTGAFDTTLDRLSWQDLWLRLARTGRVLRHRDGWAWRWMESPSDGAAASSEERARLEAKRQTLERWSAVAAFSGIASRTETSS
ncbi:hypothetical protein FRZ61_13710 [Hypericibacter adhaerens]|uniref:Glycosyltransferase 2-like domain-containing protein n=1 Tax=Hypericibacter adhaerens TaxID=2602016 RepID=A0A5J6N3H1_9PROT|nr:glycosyltransferase [Hypericibacter adhaerens]QEX21446.1 hypothetical protein FRZ61_13710 [Hypericibacter adhaerens]